MCEKYDTVDAVYRGIFDRYQNDVVYESQLQKAYEVFRPGNQVMLQYIDRWGEASGSEVALAARGYYKMSQAQNERVTKFIAEVPNKDI